MLLQITEPITNLVQEKLSQALAIGIDLGTTNSVVAFSEDGKASVLGDAKGDYLLPSVVAYLERESEPLVGEKARDLIDEAPDCVVSSTKRLMGRSAQEAYELVGKYTIIDQDSSDTMVRLKIGEHLKTPIEVAGDILRALKAQAESALNQSIEKAVITVPAYFDEAARQATKDAAALAGLTVVRLIN
jgi:molecular chaperone HscA